MRQCVPIVPAIPKAYDGGMKQPSFSRKPLLVGTITLAFAAATGIAFATWMQHGAGIFMALVESGLAWCF